MNKKCCIFGGGELAADMLPAFPESREEYIIVAADGGLLPLEESGISPDLVIGDFDSLGRVPSGDNVITLPAEKDTTDMYEAVRLGMERGCAEFLIYGGTGGRLDHTLANIQLCADISRKGCAVTLYGSGYVITAITDGKITISGRAGAYVSVFSLSDKAKGVYETGLKYSLDNAELTNMFAYGVSNEFVSDSAPAEISVRKGTLIIYYEV